ncbi:MAG: TrkH family potassium uptake protein [Aestuariivita sp.]|nr:TrkH family potassium uptake protein [Aestuariivita sp.]MCY4347070.1 TrkH family potassium uptake protein [Aestuariivita sp.]
MAVQLKILDWKNQPLFLKLMVIAALSTYIPAVHAFVRDDHETSRIFFYSGTLGLIGFLIIAIAVANSIATRKSNDFGHLISLIALFVFAPLYLALPHYEALDTATYFDAYVDMVSALTTTGADLIGDLQTVNGTIHLWRAQVAWMGGLMMWIAASAILAPLSLGGFEVTAKGQPGQIEMRNPFGARVDPMRRINRSAAVLVPTYLGLSFALWLYLIIAGESTLVAAIHAMSVLATSGITIPGSMEASGSGVIGEIGMAFFMLFALSRLTFSSDTQTKIKVELFRDPEFRIGLAVVLIASILFLLRFAMSLETMSIFQLPPEQLYRVMWGNLFTALSFLSTTGFVSAEWNIAHIWPNIGAPGLLLMGLAMIGGGVATTAGGVKLLRIYVLYINGLREIDHMIHPSSIVSRSGSYHQVERNRVIIAWVFLMLFAVSMAVLAILFSLFGVGFEESIMLAATALSNTGPLTTIVGQETLELVSLGDGTKLVFAGAMVLGRIEALAVISLIGTEVWRGEA